MFLIDSVLYSTIFPSSNTSRFENYVEHLSHLIFQSTQLLENMLLDLIQVDKMPKTLNET